MKWLLLICFFVFSNLQAAPRIDFNELRLQQLAKVMNSRDFDLMLNKLNQLEILDLACEKQKERQKIPTSCLELSSQLKHMGIRIKNENSEGLNIAASCESSIEELAEADLVNLLKQKHLLPARCQQQIALQLKILTYKRTGKRFE